MSKTQAYKPSDSRVRHLEHVLSILQYHKALRAFDFVIEEMSNEKGFARSDGTHYYYHLVDVAQILINFGIREESIIVSALLHDAVEDIDWVTPEYIERIYGSDVRDIVMRVTKKQGVDYKADTDEMNRYLEQIESRYESALVKTADRIHNFSTMSTMSQKYRMKQVVETREMYIPFFKRCRKRYVRHSGFFYFAKTVIEPILSEIESSDHKIRILENQFRLLKDGVYGVSPQTLH